MIFNLPLSLDILYILGKIISEEVLIGVCRVSAQIFEITFEVRSCHHLSSRSWTPTPSRYRYRSPCLDITSLLTCPSKDTMSAVVCIANCLVLFGST